MHACLQICKKLSKISITKVKKTPKTMGWAQLRFIGPVLVDT